MMKYVSFAQTTVRKLPFYLATEEYLAANFPDDEYFFMWQVNPTVIFGRNQLIENEVNLDFVKENHIEFYRRKSGGGCVYSDWSNIMFSFVTPSFNKDFVFSTYLAKVVGVLKGLGLNAYASGRNDILVDGLKVSGNAFYMAGNKSIVHGTMLFDTDMSVLVRAITPSNEKLISKGIDSVRKRVTNLKEHLSISIDDFKSQMKHEITDGEIVLTAQDEINIAKIEANYYLESFIYGKNPKYTIIRKGYTKAGMIEVAFELKNNLVKGVNLLGDYFLFRDIAGMLAPLRDIPFTREAFETALSGVIMGDFVMNLDTTEFLDTVFKKDDLVI